jgi:hypothetical protein
VKLHGTNAGVVRDLATGETWAQSREHIITIERDNAGFAFYVASQADAVARLFAAATERAGLQPGDSHIAIFGEWCGQGIQRGVAISSLPKMFVVFGIRVIADAEPAPFVRWLPKDDVSAIVRDAGGAFFCIYDFPTYRLTIDFAQPEMSQNELVRITDAVEASCPVGVSLGAPGVGEGVVWTIADDAVSPIQTHGLTFKVKGQKHSDSKVKVTAEIDMEKLASVQAFADTVLTDHRLEKMVNKLEEDGIAITIENTSAFLKAACGDVIKEETDRLVASGMEWKAVAGAVSKGARQWWMKRLDSEVFSS